jgi:hypothetical protein
MDKLNKNKYIDGELYQKVQKNCKKFLTKQHYLKGKNYWIDDIINEAFVHYLGHTKDATIIDLQNRPNPKDAIGRYIRGIAFLLWADKRKPLANQIWNYNITNKTLEENKFEDLEENITEYTTTVKDKIDIILDDIDYFDKILFCEYINAGGKINKTSENTKIPPKRTKKYIDKIKSEIIDKLENFKKYDDDNI